MEFCWEQAVGFTLVETLGQYMPEIIRNVTKKMGLLLLVSY